MIELADRLHCPSCRGRLVLVSADALGCGDCHRTIPVDGAIADFVRAAGPDVAADQYHESRHRQGMGAAELLGQMRQAAGDRWPAFLGDAIAFGCGSGEAVQAIVLGRMTRSLLVLDSSISVLRDCQLRIAQFGAGHDQAVAYAALSGGQNAIRDAVADTILGTGLLAGIGDVRAFLAMVRRVLKPGGRAAFVIPNRRFYKAMSLAMADALVRCHGRDGVWPEGQAVVLELLAQTRRRLVHHGDLGFLAALEEKHLFDSDSLRDMGEEVGFDTAKMIPLHPDPAGAETTSRICLEAGADDASVKQFGPLVAAVGEPYFGLLGRQDSSASMLLWLTKASGPQVRIFMHRPPPPSVNFADRDAAVGGVAPRWSIELLAHDSPGGIMVAVGGWCLCNTDVLWVRIALNEVVRCAPVWRPRPDVHEVLNRNGFYRSLNTLCSGLANDLLFDDVHPTDGTCGLRLDILLTNQMIVVGPAPDVLVMNEPTVIAH